MTAEQEARELAQRFGVRMCDENGDTHDEELYCLGIDDIIEMKKALSPPESDEQKDAARWRYMKQKGVNWPAIVDRASDIDFDGGLDEAVDEAIAAHGKE